MSVKRLFILPALAFLAAALSGCFTSEPTGPSAGNVQKSDSVSAKGKDKLDGVFEQMTSSQFRYGNEDLSELRAANAAFAQALALNPDNKEARLGAALTGVLLAMQSERLSGLINDASNAPSPLNLGFAMNAPLARVGVLAKVSESGFPEIHALQDAVADTLLPVLESAIANLAILNNDPAFSMTLTISGSTREIDHAEIAILLAGFKTLHALATLVLSYDLDFDDDGSYDYLDVIGEIDDWDNLTVAEKAALDTLTGLLDKNGPFLAARPDWAARLAQVDNNIHDALGILKEGLISIKAESDPQHDDVLRRCATGGGPQGGCISIQDIDKAAADIDSVRKYMNQPYPVSFADTTIHVNLAAWLGVQDYKKMLPHYAFYDAGVWSSDKPVFHFTTPGGQETGNLKTVNDLLSRSDEEGWTVAETLDSLKPVIRWQDPTFQGFLPGATEAGVWRLLQLAMEQDEEDWEGDWEEGQYDSAYAETPLAKRGPRRLRSTATFLDPRLPLLLLRN